MIEPSALHLVAAFIGALAVVVLALAVFLPHTAARSRPVAGAGDEKSLSSLAARIPISEVRDDLIVRRDGSFCAGWECNGVATQFANAERLEALSSTLDAFIKSIRHPEIELQFRYVIDCETARVLDERKAAGNCVNSAAGWLEENRAAFWRSAMDSGQVRSMRLLVFLSWKPARTWETRSPGSRFAAAFWQGLAQQGLGKLPSIMKTALAEAGTKALVQRNRAEHSRLVAEFNQILETYRIGLEAITPVRRQSETELLRLLYQALNPADRQVPRENGEST